MTQQISMEAFLDALATASPTPGGGSVAALVGATSAGLVSMVCRLTLPKTEDGDLMERLNLVDERADELRVLLTSLVDRDARSYDAVIAAYRLPKDTEMLKKKRREAIQGALKVAASVPAETAQAALEVLALAHEIARDSSRNAISDVAVAAHMGLASLASAWVNVQINLGSIHDKAFASELAAQATSDQERAKELHKNTVQVVDSILGADNS